MPQGHTIVKGFFSSLIFFCLYDRMFISVFSALLLSSTKRRKKPNRLKLSPRPILFLDKAGHLDIPSFSMKTIPLHYAAKLGCTKSYLVRVNLGKRRLSIDLAIELHRLSRGRFPVLDTRPDLARLRPFLCSPKGKEHCRGPLPSP